jgi:hypothetical protein
MPLAGGKYKDFNACVMDQKSKGHDDESAKKICGKLEQMAGEKSSAEKMTEDGKFIVKENVNVRLSAQVEIEG